MDRFSGADALVRALEAEGVDTVFGTVGHGNLAFVDALLDSSIRYVSVFHEQVAIHAADAYFRVSGRLAAVTTTVGPGFTNLATGLGDALLDSSAVLVISGGVPSAYLGREPLQELALHSADGQPEIFRHLSKRVIRIASAHDLEREAHRAARLAQSGNPGPVILHVPMDHFSERISADPRGFPRFERTRVVPSSESIDHCVAVLRDAERPLVLLGGGAVLSGAQDTVTQLVDVLGIPVVTTMSGQGAIDEEHPLALGFTGVVGTRPANEAARNADLLIAVGTRFPEMDASSWRSEHFTSIPPAKLIHIDVDENQIGKIYPTEVPVIADANEALRHILQSLGDDSDVKELRASWGAWRDQVSVEEDEWQETLDPVRSTPTFPYEPAHLLTELRRHVPDDLILVTGVGVRHAIGQHFPIRNARSQVVASGFGTMGQEVAAPIGAKLGAPDRPVLGIVGDGAVLACLAALPTAVSAGIHAVWIVLNNDGYASIAVYQSKHFGRHHGTYFSELNSDKFQPSYVDIARSFGARSVAVTDPSELPDLLRTAFEEPATWVIEVPVTARPSILGSGHWDVNDILASQV